jgi:hypothetical protein
MKLRNVVQGRIALEFCESCLTPFILPAEIRKPPGFWTAGDHSASPDASHNNIRLFFDKFASSKHMDGTIPENWFSFSKRDILQEKVSISFQPHYQIENIFFSHSQI